MPTLNKCRYLVHDLAVYEGLPDGRGLAELVFVGGEVSAAAHQDQVRGGGGAARQPRLLAAAGARVEGEPAYGLLKQMSLIFAGIKTCFGM